MADPLTNNILRIIKENGPLSTQEIINISASDNVFINKKKLNGLLYGNLNELLIRDKDEKGYPLWRIRGKEFEAAKGLEIKFANELIKNKIIDKNNITTDYTIQNLNNKKLYHLDIAIFTNNKKINIEIDGFEHIRADAMFSIQNQLIKGERKKIIIDWMDNCTSYLDFNLIDNKAMYKWFNLNRKWCVKFHEELLKPHDITRNIWLIEHGWKIIRFWNFQINDEAKECLNIIRNYI